MKLGFALALGALVLSGAAEAAGLTGVQVDGTMNVSGLGSTNFFDPGLGSIPAGYGNSTSPLAVTIGSGIEFGYADGANTDTADFTDSQLILTDISNGGSAPITFSFTSTTPGGFAGLSLVSSDFSVPLFYSLVGDTITVGWEESFFTPRGQQQTFHATFDIAPGAGAVPEPATWAMMLLGFGGMGMALRRSPKRVALAA